MLAEGPGAPARFSPRAAAVFTALLVTFLWSTSWVLITVGLEDLPALTFAGIRYTLALPFLLTPLLANASAKQALAGLSGARWLALGGLGGLVGVTQGAQFLGLALLPAVTVSLLLNFTTLVVAAISFTFLGERPGMLQWIGALLASSGAVLYFHPAAFADGQSLGLAIVAVGVLANALAAVVGRGVNRTGDLAPIAVTTVTLGVCGLGLLSAGVAVQGIPELSLRSWLIVLWLAAINTAVAFTLWNRALRTLHAVEASVINNTMLIQIAILVWVFLGEALGTRELAGVALVAVGALLVQLRRVA
jgi:drug/metabolite transporter (DMT)-like permease